MLQKSPEVAQVLASEASHSRSRRWLTIVGLAVAALGLAGTAWLWWSGAQNARAAACRTDKAAIADVRSVVVATGTIEPVERVAVSSSLPVQAISRRQRTLLRRHFLGFVFQGYNLLTHSTAVENVELPLTYRGVGRRERRSRRWSASAWRAGPTTCPPPCREGSSSAWPLPAPSSADRPCWWPMSRRAISIRCEAGTL